MKRQGKRFAQFFQKYQAVIFYTVCAIVVLLSIAVWFRFVILGSANAISNVDFSSDDVKEYDDIKVYDKIREVINGRNSVLRRFSKGSAIAEIQKTYPFVADLRTISYENNILTVDVIFTKPRFLFSFAGSGLVGVYSEKYLLDVVASNQITEGVPRYVLPDYVTRREQLAGIFFDIAVTKLEEFILFAKSQYEPLESLVYMPGAKRVIVTRANGKKLIFHLEKDREIQQKLAERIEQNPSQFGSRTELDLSSIDYLFIR